MAIRSLKTGAFSRSLLVGNAAYYPNVTVDYLVVAGGGGGNSGGGGAGGLRCTVTATGGGGSLESALSLTPGNSYTITIGAGGIGGVGDIQPTSGSNSVFSTITSTGGGYGGRQSVNNTSASGGSGGGGGRNSSTYGTGTSNQGYAGGAGISAGTYDAGGGGGAGAGLAKSYHRLDRSGISGSSYGQNKSKEESRCYLKVNSISSGKHGLVHQERVLSLSARRSGTNLGVMVRLTRSSST